METTQSSQRDTSTHNGVRNTRSPTCKVGKSLVWSETENKALSPAAVKVLLDPATGSAMNKIEKARRIRAAFIRDIERPPDACTTDDRGPMDSRRWDGRTARAVLGQWEILRRECTKYHACVKRVKAAQLTGNPTEEELLRCASLVYSDGSKATSHLYDCIRNRDYHVAKPFRFRSAYEVLSESHIMLEAFVVTDDGNSKVNRTEGVKAAKKRKAEQLPSAHTGTEAESDRTLKKLHDMIEESIVSKRAVAELKLQYQQEKMDWDMAKTLLGPGSEATVEERRAISGLLRKRLISRLTQASNAEIVKQVSAEGETNANTDEQSCASALLQISAVSTSEKVGGAVSEEVDNLN